jgi:hypothetical protein
MDMADTLKDVKLLDVMPILGRHWRIIVSILGVMRNR